MFLLLLFSVNVCFADNVSPFYMWQMLETDNLSNVDSDINNPYLKLYQQANILFANDCSRDRAALYSCCKDKTLSYKLIIFNTLSYSCTTFEEAHAYEDAKTTKIKHSNFLTFILIEI